MRIDKWMIGISLCLALCSSASLPSQTAKVGPKEAVPVGEQAGGSELEHMSHLVAQLKLDAAKIQDPAAKKAAEDNVDLWGHMLDKMMRENASANNVGKEHHHTSDPAPPALKQSPKPPQ